MAEIFTAAELAKEHFAPLRWAVQGLVPEGYHLLVGAPKAGKSFLAMDLAAAVASGKKALGEFPTTEADVLYLALEDGKRRLQERLRGRYHGDRLHLAIKWQRHGIRQIEDWLQECPEASLVIIDVLEHFRQEPLAGSRKGIYQEDYGAMKGVAELADKYHVAIMVLHHTRKPESADFVSLTSGTHGLTGSCDGIFNLKRDRHKNTGILQRTGRDCEELAIKLSFDDSVWTYDGLAGEEDMDTNSAIIKAVRNAEGDVGYQDVADATGQPFERVKKAMQRLAREGRGIESVSRGRYRGSKGMTLADL